MIIRSLILAAGLAVSFTATAAAQQFGGHVEYTNIDREGDLEILAASAELSGRVGGDLPVFAANIQLDAVIEGDLEAAGANVEASGRVLGDAGLYGGSVESDVDILGNAELFGGFVNYAGEVSGSLDAGAGLLEIDEGAVVSGAADMGGQEVVLRGRFLSDVDVRAEDVQISGQIDGDIEIEAVNLRIDPSAVINGSIRYTGPNEPDIDSGATLSEEIDFTRRDVDIDWEGDWKGVNLSDLDIVPPKEFFAVLGIGFSFLLGLIALALMPNGVARLSHKFREQPLLAPLLGLFLLPMGMLMLLMAGTIILAITVIGGVLIPFWWMFGLLAILLAYPLGAIAVGDMIFSRLGRSSPGFGMRLLGFLVILVLSTSFWLVVPPLALISWIILSWIGLGSWMLAAFGRKDANGALASTPPAEEAV